MRKSLSRLCAGRFFLRKQSGEDFEETGKWYGGRRVWYILTAIIFLAIALRLANISTESYWGDEIMSLDIVEHFQGFSEMIRYIREVEFHPPLYYLMLQPWVHAFGAGEAATRSLSLIFSVANVVAVFFLGRELFRRNSVGLVSAFIMAVLPIQVEFGQEARPYAMVCFAATVAALAMWKYLRSHSWRWLVVYAAATIFGLYLNYSYILVAVALTGWWLGEVLVRSKGRVNAVRDFLMGNTLIFLAFYPWLDALLFKLMLSDFMIYGMPRFVENYRTLGLFTEILDLLFWVIQVDRVPHLLATVYATAYTALIFAGGIFAYRLGGTPGRERRILPIWYLAYLCAALMLLFIASPLSVPYAPLYVRHALFFTVPFAVLLAEVLVSFGRWGWFLGAFFLVVIVPPLVNVMGDDGVWEYQHRLAHVSQYVADQAQAGDLVIVNRTAVRSDFAHYIPDDIPVVALLPLNYYGNDIWSSRQTLGLVENESQVRGYRPGTVDKVLTDGSMVTEQAVLRKLDQLMQLHGPQRVWLYSFNDSDTEVHGWFKEHGWRRAMATLGKMFALDLYVPRTEIIDDEHNND